MPGGGVRSGPDGLESLAESGVGAATTFREADGDVYLALLRERCIRDIRDGLPTLSLRSSTCTFTDTGG